MRVRALALSFALALLLGACASGGSTEGLSSIEALRRAAKAQPADRDAQRALALAELFAWNGDPERVDAQLARALALDAGNARLWLVSGLQHDAHGRPDQALDAYLRALTVALETDIARDPLAPHIAELSAHAIAGVEGGVTDYPARVLGAILPILRDPRLPMPARVELGALVMQQHYKHGDRAAAQAIATQLGCVTELRAAGPFGPRELLGFDQDHGGIRPGVALAASYELGAGRGVRPTRDVGGRGCTVHLGGGPLAMGGSTYVQGYVEIAKAGQQLLRFETPNSVDLHIDGISVLRIDRRQNTAPETAYVPVQLSAGRHEVLIKLTTRHPNPAMAMAVAPMQASDARAIEWPSKRNASAGFARYLRAAIALGRGDAVEARLSLLGVEDGRAAPLLQLQRASVMMVDPLMPGQLAQDEARRLYEQAVAHDPGLWNPTAQLAQMADGNGRTKEAIAAMRNAVRQFPNVPALRLSLASMLKDQGWDAEADRVIAGARKLVPDACAPIGAELDSLRDRQREQAAAALSEKLMACEAQANARYSTLLRQRRFDDASVELERLAALDPPQHRFAWALARLELAKNRHDEATVQRQITELRTLYPRTSSALIEQLDRLAASGKPEAALKALDAALAAEPAALAGARRLAPLLGGEDTLKAYRKDGAAAIAAFEASGHTYEAPQVLVFDYMAAQVMPDGSSIELVHTIQKAQSDEALDELAEVSVPDGARVLTLRAIKPDGRKLEPDAIAGKDTISLPTLTPGDYVETELLLYRDAPDAFPGGHSGERFFFQSYEIPFDHSEMIVILPSGMPYSIDPRGPAPKVEEKTQGDQRVLRFLVEGSKALQPEPMSITPREILPSVRLAANATWPLFIESIREALIDRDLVDPEIAAQVKKIIGDAAPNDFKLRTKRLYDWVLANIENDDDLLSQAAVMIRSKSGNRARVLHYALKLAGVPTKLALVRTAAADSTPSEMADGDVYEHLLVSYDGGKGPVWLFTAERWAPFGFMPALLSGQPGLLLEPPPAGSKNGLAMVTMPVRDPSLDGRRLELDVALQPDGGAQMTFVETVRGGSAIGWRNQLESVPSAELKHRFEEEYAGRLVPGAQLTSLAITGREQDSEMLRIEMGMQVSSFGRRLDHSLVLPLLLASDLSATYARMAVRTTTQLISGPQNTEIVIRVKPPQGGALPRVPAPIAIAGNVPGKPRFAFKASAKDGTLTLERALSFPIMKVSPSDYPAFAKFCRDVDAVEAQELVVRMP